MTIELRDLLWLLLPVAAASGWCAARREARRAGAASNPVVSAEYLRGVSFLLNEQPDRAVEVFTRMLETSADAVEMHLALGSLFRRRGEVERAIHIHQELISRDSLDNSQRSQARFELALDYQKAGLLDRAEALFEELSQLPEHTEQALRSLIHIYEQEKDWHKASAAQRRWMRSTGSDHSGLLAQYQCEIADQALRRRDYRSVGECVEQALALDPGCARARHLAAQTLVAQGEDRKAIAVWQEIESVDPEFLDEIVPGIVSAYCRINDPAGLRQYLGQLMSRHPGMNTLLFLSDAMRNSVGVEGTRRYLVEQMRAHPSAAGIVRLMELFQESGSPASRDEIVLLKDAMLDLMRRQKGYSCRQCGYRGEALHWQCPACFEWMTMRPAANTGVRNHDVASTAGMQPAVSIPAGRPS